MALKTSSSGDAGERGSARKGVSPAVDALIDALQGATRFEHIVVVGQRGLGIGTGNVLHTSWPAPVLREYLDRELFRADPVAEALLKFDRPVYPRDILEIADSNPAYAPNLAFRRDAGLTIPHAVPIVEGSAKVGSVGISLREPLSTRQLDVFVAIAPELHRQLSRFANGRAAVAAQLSRREIDCLAWASEGKTAWETGVILGISERTVVAHLTSAMAKLGTTSRLHAVVLAMRAGLLE